MVERTFVGFKHLQYSNGDIYSLLKRKKIIEITHSTQKFIGETLNRENQQMFRVAHLTLIVLTSPLQ